MRDLVVVHILKSRYCQAIFVIAFLVSYFFIPKVVLAKYTYLAFLFMASFSLTMTCITRNIKEKIHQSKAYGGSLIGLIASILGIGALQVCGLATPFCAGGVGMSIMSFMFSNYLFSFFEKYAVHVVILSITLQIFSLYAMGCFKKIRKFSAKKV